MATIFGDLGGYLLYNIETFAGGTPQTVPAGFFFAAVYISAGQTAVTTATGPSLLFNPTGSGSCVVFKFILAPTINAL